MKIVRQGLILIEINVFKLKRHTTNLHNSLRLIIPFKMRLNSQFHSEQRQEAAECGVIQTGEEPCPQRRDQQEFQETGFDSSSWDSASALKHVGAPEMAHSEGGRTPHFPQVHSFRRDYSQTVFPAKMIDEPGDRTVATYCVRSLKSVQVKYSHFRMNFHFPTRNSTTQTSVPQQIYLNHNMDSVSSEQFCHTHYECQITQLRPKRQLKDFRTIITLQSLLGEP